MTSQRHTDSIMTSTLTALVANEALDLGKKIVSVLLLAVLTEVVRHVVNAVIARIQKRKS